MPVAYLPDETRQRVTITLTGVVPVDQVIAMLDLQVRDGTWAWSVLYDGSRRVEAFSSAEIHRLAEAANDVARRHGRRGPVAIVRPTDLGFGVARMFSMLSGHHAVAVQVFRDLVSAEHWLDSVASG
jgi:hypothetical protein